MKHSLLENDNYVDALIDANDALFTVDLTHGQLEQTSTGLPRCGSSILQMTLPCSYDDYCAQRRHFVTPETLETTASWTRRQNCWSASTRASST